MSRPMRQQVMTAPPERARKSADPDLIGRLRKAIDMDYMAPRLAASRCGPLAAARMVGCEVARVFPRGARGFAIAYSVRLLQSGRISVTTLHGELVPGDAEAHYRAVLSRFGGDLLRVPPSPCLVAYIADPGLVLRRPGHDEALPGLHLLHHPGELPSILAACGLSVPATAHGLSARLLAHRLGKRAVVRFSWRAPTGIRGARGNRSVVAKLFRQRKDRARHGHDLMRALHRNGLDGRQSVRVPRMLGHSAQQAAIILEDVPGRPLDRLHLDAMPAGMALAGRALAQLHRCRVRGLKTHGAKAEIDLLEPWVDLIGRVRPALRPTLEPALAALRSDLAHVDAAPAGTIHRDFHPKQLFVDDGMTTLIDFDTLCAGDPALDIGNFLAHLRLTTLQSGWDTGACATAFLRGYGTSPDRDLAYRSSVYERSARLRLACLYALSTRWGALAGPLLRDTP